MSLPSMADPISDHLWADAFSPASVKRTRNLDRSVPGDPTEGRLRRYTLGIGLSSCSGVAACLGGLGTSFGRKAFCRDAIMESTRAVLPLGLSRMTARLNSIEFEVLSMSTVAVLPNGTRLS